MQQISWTRFYKWFFAVLCGLGAVTGVVGVVSSGVSGPGYESFVVGWPLFIAFFYYAGMKAVGVFDMVDQVFDAGEALIVRKGDRVERVLLADIIDVYHYHSNRTPCVTLKLRTPSQFGDQFSFCTGPLEPFFGPSAVITELIRRIWAARLSNAR